MYLYHTMSCKTISIEELPIKTHSIKLLDNITYETENNKTEHEINISIDQNYSFIYCVSYRDPNLDERILARWFWNDNGIWTPDWIFPM